MFHMRRLPFPIDALPAGVYNLLISKSSREDPLLSLLFDNQAPPYWSRLEEATLAASRTLGPRPAASTPAQKMVCIDMIPCSALAWAYTLDWLQWRQCARKGLALFQAWSAGDVSPTGRSGRVRQRQSFSRTLLSQVARYTTSATPC